ncbi:MAG TPA: uracil-DNA glycosylase [Spirochaetota bacterium]|nr:uracil-DNA glycosylase [Spirochaetota bacterium]HPJ34293.1 uracil-DNA glycosylase [Spirochaetota bacterium]
MKKTVRECKWYRVCPMKFYYEQGRLDKKWITSFCKGDWLNCVRYRMEERGEYHPDNMLPDGSIDKRL